MGKEVNNLVFYAQSTSTVISGRRGGWGWSGEGEGRGGEVWRWAGGGERETHT